MIHSKQTLFDYVYSSLREHILSGRLDYGARLPSMTALCATYHVGVRTIKDVLLQLKKEGYIQTEERRPAVVVYRHTGLEDGGGALRSVLSKRRSIQAVYQTLTVLMPPIFAFSIRLCSDARLEEWSRSLARAKSKGPWEARWHIFSCILYELLEDSNNLLFMDLFVSLELHARLPLFQELDRFHQLVAEECRTLDVAWVMESLLTRDQGEITCRFQLMFRAVQGAVGRFLEELSQAAGPIPPSDQPGYSWTADRGRDHYYVQIARSLVHQIGSGFYREGSFLPPEAVLAQEYHVCVTTIRSAMAMLNQLGLGRTLNAKGTQVVRPDSGTLQQCLKNRTYRRDTLVYLSGLQLMVLAIGPAALLAFDEIGEDAREKIRRLLQTPGCDLLHPLFQCVMDCLPLSPLKNILSEGSRVLHWGYYFRFYLGGPIGGTDALQKGRAAARCLCAGEPHGFARSLSQCYGAILDGIRPMIELCGLPEAGRMPTPVPNLEGL